MCRIKLVERRVFCSAAMCCSWGHFIVWILFIALCTRALIQLSAKTMLKMSPRFRSGEKLERANNSERRQKKDEDYLPYTSSVGGIVSTVGRIGRQPMAVYTTSRNNIHVAQKYFVLRRTYCIRLAFHYAVTVLPGPRSAHGDRETHDRCQRLVESNPTRKRCKVPARSFREGWAWGE